VLAGCGDETGPSSTDEVSFTIAGLAASSPASGHYELWISFFQPTGARHEAAAISCGKFRINSLGNVVGLDGQAIRFAVNGLPAEQRDANGVPIWLWAEDAFVTLEPDGDADDVPTYPGFLGGARLNDRMVLGTDHGDALGDDFSAAQGAALLATPSTSDPSDEAKGVWFTETGALASALLLPALGDTGGGAGWIYEGWVQASGLGPASLGRFVNPAAPDDDGAFFLGDQPGYAFPGSDYPYGAAHPDLAPSTVFVTVEPAGGHDGPTPFRALTVLRGPIPSGWPAGTHLTLSGTASELPRGEVVLPLAP
jgi:hypothetical protein